MMRRQGQGWGWLLYALWLALPPPLWPLLPSLSCLLRAAWLARLELLGLGVLARLGLGLVVVMIRR